MTGITASISQTQAAPLGSRASSAQPTVWGMGPEQLHDRFWASRGVQVVRQGERSLIVSHAELYLLAGPRTLSMFKLMRAVEVLSWLKPQVLFVRIHDERERPYRERVLTRPDGSFLKFERDYGGSDARLARIALTPERRLALLWQSSPSVREAWKALRQEVGRADRSVLSENGRVFDLENDAEVAAYLRELAKAWKHPDTTIPRPRRWRPGVWADPDSTISPDVISSGGGVWVGAGRKIEGGIALVGPRILWDDPARRPPVDDIQWLEIEPAPSLARPVQPRHPNSLSRAGKRLFDLVFAALALLLTCWIYPIVMFAIWMEDGGPFFFRHRRETMGGREFNCIKFRSMRKDADEIKKQLAAHNQADGPQFYMENDPRMTAVGRFIRKTYIDELPQFWNVLTGDMSIVGPRPSPRKENQYCPPWREARLSVRPGVTGLWQVRRTRRKGQDFQEWIRYDLEYVENASGWLDLKIILQTMRMVLHGVFRI